MTAMPKKMPPYVTRDKTRHGQVRYYFRRKHGLRTRLPDLYAPDFDQAYMAALTGTPIGASAPAKKKVGEHTLEWLITQYRLSGAYQALAPSTRRARDNILAKVIADAGSVPYKAITRKHIIDGRERRKGTPALAGHFIKIMRGLFQWALDNELVEGDPTINVAKPKLPNKNGIPVWTEDDVAKYEEFWPLGTNERVWFDVLLYTGLRKSDAVLLGRQHVRDGVATIRTIKTGTEVSIPILAPLRRSLDAGPTGDLHFIVGKAGKPMSKEGFGNMFRVACNAAGITKSAHGLRKAAATRAAEAGATVAELEAMFGWSGGNMASLYTKSANRRRLALRGWENSNNKAGA